MEQLLTLGWGEVRWVGGWVGLGEAGSHGALRGSPGSGPDQGGSHLVSCLFPSMDLREACPGTREPMMIKIGESSCASDIVGGGTLSNIV